MRFILPLFSVNAGVALASCAHGTYLQRRGTGNEEPELPDFDYGPVRGPTYWHGLSPENFLCGVGREQSPINVNNSIPVEQAGIIDIKVPVQEAELLNLGTTVEVILGGNTLIDGCEYELRQFHFHTPSEHWIEGKHYPMEIHMVHEAKGQSNVLMLVAMLMFPSDDPSSLAVIALFVQLSSTQTFHTLESIILHVDAISEPGSTVEIQNLNVTDIVDVVNEASFYRYSGSLTTPPCTEGVQFFIAQDPIPLRTEKYNDLKEVLGFNARFIQSTWPAKNVLTRASESL